MVFFIFVVLLLIIIMYLFKHSLFGSSRLPPGPNALQVLMNLSRLVKQPHIALNEFAKSYGSIFSFRIGTKVIVVASSPDAAKKFTRIHDHVFSGRHLPSLYNYMPGILNSSIVLSVECNKSWKFLRSIGQSFIFSSSVVESNALLINAKIKEMEKYIHGMEDKAINLEETIFATITNIISSVLASKDIFNIENEAMDNFTMMIATVNEVIEKTITLDVVDFLPFLKGIDFWSKGRAKDLHSKIMFTWGDIVKERRLHTNENEIAVNDFLGKLLEDGFSDDQICSVLMELLIGATDTTSITTVWMMVELLRSQDILCKVREEIAHTIEGEGDKLNDSLLSNCSFFQACIKETLRLHVPAPLLVPHRALEMYNVDKYIIPKDSMVLVNSSAIAQDPKYWEDAKNFKPQRFLNSKIGYRGTHFEYLPFGTGVRMCPGVNLAFKTIGLMVASLLFRFDWTLPNAVDPINIDMNEKYTTTLKKEKPLILVPKLREIKMTT